MSVKLSEEKYKKLKKEAAKNRQILVPEGIGVKEKEKIAYDHADSLIFDNDEEKQLYIANFLIPDDKLFYEIYKKNGKNLKKCAAIFEVSFNIILARVFEFGKYQEYMPKIFDKKGEQKMGEIEIIGVLPAQEKSNNEKKSEENVESNTTKAIGKINQLLEINVHQESVISSQAKTIEAQETEIQTLEAKVKEMDSVISTQKDSIKKKDEEISDNDKTIKELEEEIEDYRQTIKKLTTYKENYDKIISFLENNASEPTKGLK